MCLIQALCTIESASWFLICCCEEKKSNKEKATQGKRVCLGLQFQRGIVLYEDKAAGR